MSITSIRYSNNWWKSLAIFGLLFCIIFGNETIEANACSVPPTLDRSNQSFKRMMDSADHVFIGRVAYVLRRRWSEDDTRPGTHRKWLEYAEIARAGGDVGSNQYIVNWVEYAEATAYLKVDIELYKSGLLGPKHNVGILELVPIDLLRPFTVAGHGPCDSFPQTCPWDVASGDTVALAIIESRFGAQKALICQKIPRITSKQRKKARYSPRDLTKFEAIRPFIKLFQQ